MKGSGSKPAAVRWNEDAGHDVNVPWEPPLQRLDAAFREDGLVPFALQLQGNRTAA